MIRTERPEDYKAIYSIHALAFGGENEAKLIDILRQTTPFVSELSLVAFKNNEPVGHILFYPLLVKNNERNVSTLGLVPLAVKPHYQNQGYGTTLVKEGLERAKKMGFNSVFVAGDPSFYGRFGFKPIPTIENNLDISKESLLALELIKNSLNTIRGTLYYPPEFEIIR